MQRLSLFCKRLLALFVDWIVLTTMNAVLQPLLMIGYLIAASPGPGGEVRNGVLVSLLLGGPPWSISGCSMPAAGMRRRASC